MNLPPPKSIRFRRELCGNRAQAEAILIDGDRVWRFYTNRWISGAIEPRGHVHIESFRPEGRTPIWTYAFSELRLKMAVWMEPGADTTYVASAYTVRRWMHRAARGFATSC